MKYVNYNCHVKVMIELDYYGIVTDSEKTAIEIVEKDVLQEFAAYRPDIDDISVTVIKEES